MASDIEICNLALSHLGDTATVASLDPPEGSPQASHCAQFYPIARDSLLEMHAWGFATKRIQLAQLGSGWPEWTYAYAKPNDTVNILAVLPPDATDDYSQSTTASNDPGLSASAMEAAIGGSYVPKPFSCEVDENGADVIYTDQINAVLRYTALIDNPAKFSPLFALTLSWHLASMLAGPLMKGEAGAAESKRCTLIAFGNDGKSGVFGRAVASDASQRRILPQQNVPWINGR
ncbi:MAG: hypothetical protein PHW66_06435 [Gallionella sp.]|nr:hypothetical protein [Gallionella sp.]